jgi:hypothetical protein
VYFLGNDNILEWAIAFLESYRCHNPDLPLTLIPFNDRTDRLQALSGRFAFRTLNHPRLNDLDEIGRCILKDTHPAHKQYLCGTFRKLAAFLGDFEQFFFLDADVVVLGDLQPFLAVLPGSGKKLLYCDADMDQVYLTGPFRDRMIAEHGAVGFNTGAFGSCRGALSLADIERLGEQALTVKHSFVLTAEQPFLNYCFDVSELAYAHYRTVVDDTSRFHWAGYPHYHDRQGWRVSDPSAPDVGNRVRFLHWAGVGLRWSMPYRHVFLHYRCRSMSLWGKLDYRLRMLGKHVAGRCRLRLSQAKRALLSRSRPR